MLTNVHDFVGSKSFLITHKKICAFGGIIYSLLGKERIVVVVVVVVVFVVSSSSICCCCFAMWLQVTKTRVLFCGTLTYHS